MNISVKSTTDYEILIGEQFRRLRIAAELDQIQLANAANVSLGAIKNLEKGSGSSLKTLIRVARVFNQEKWLESLYPLTTVSPMQILRDQKLNKPRQRVYKTRKVE
ncbi:MAG: helix-turn-helix transcriptional regulator [Methylotenera sp.]|nr:helix-turn-helix transcriptional regulator [Methylotenera sp.]